jgi:uncharacterized membrane protein YvbJ
MVFDSFDTVSSVMRGTFTLSSVYVLIRSIFVASNLLLVVVVVFFGSRLTKAAERVKASIVKYFTRNQLDQQNILTLMQVQSRNLHIENDFFKIDWNVLTTVSF